MSAVALMAPPPPMGPQGPFEPQGGPARGGSEGLVSMVNRLAIERVQASETRMHQVMNQVSDTHVKRQVAIQFLDQITRCTDGTGKLNVASMDPAVVSKALELFGNRLGEVSGTMSAQATAQLRQSAESVERQFSNLEVTDQMKLQQLVQHLQREVQLFTNLIERLQRICETAIEGIRGR